MTQNKIICLDKTKKEFILLKVKITKIIHLNDQKRLIC